jgi:4-hydroxybenzoate polyprenyltransferase
MKLQGRVPAVTLRKYLEFVRFEHTLFALPFGLAAMAVASRETHGWPGWRTFLLILAAMSERCGR